MQKKFLVLSLSLIFSLNNSFSQSFKEKFDYLIEVNDTIGQQQILDNWEKSDINDPELYVAYFNYYVNKSHQETITLGQDPQGEVVYQIMDQDSSQKEPVGFLYGGNYYEPNILNKGFEWINKGIEKHPNRLDMRFGKIYIYGQLEDYDNFTKEILKTIDYSSKNKNNWTWSENKPVEDAKKMFLGSIQDYQIQLYKTENDSLLNNMKQIAERILKYYPDHIESLSNLSIVYTIYKQYDKAIDYLLEAYKINPKDFIVLYNIAHAYELKGDVQNAIKYYKLTIEYGDQEAIEYSKEQIKLLEEKK
jgi:tetratricopeptide (TPR) repeat protein